MNILQCSMHTFACPTDNFPKVVERWDTCRLVLQRGVKRIVLVNKQL